MNMKNVKPKTSIMRNDYDFSVEPQRIDVHPLGFEKMYAGPGDWINFRNNEEDAATGVGRVIGVAKTHVNSPDPYCGTFLIVAALSLHGHVMMRWIRPEWVAGSHPGPPKRAMEFLCGEWNDPQVICDVINDGMLEDYARSGAFVNVGKELVKATGRYGPVFDDWQTICDAADKSAAALQVLLKTPHIRAYLEEHDPKALEQALRAVEEQK